MTFDALLAAVPFILLLLIGLTHLAQAVAGGPAVDPNSLFHRFFPRLRRGRNTTPSRSSRSSSPASPGIGGRSRSYAAPAFLWFSTRLFAGVRTSLNDIYDVSSRPSRRRHFALNWLSGKLRDMGMVVATVVLFLANTLLTTGLAIVASRGRAQLPQFAFFVSTLGRLLGELLAFSFSVSLFYVTYRYASVRRLPWRTALLASTFTAVLFEVAKRLYGLYLANFASLEGPLGDANVGARPCSSCSGCSTPPSSSCWARWSRRRGSCASCSNASAPRSAETQGLLRQEPKPHASIPFDPLLLVSRCWRRPAGRPPRSGPADSCGASPAALRADHAAILEADSAFETAANAGNVSTGSLAVYADDASLLPPNEPPVKGRQAIRQYWGRTLDAYTLRFELSTDRSMDGAIWPTSGGTTSSRRARRQGNAPSPTKGNSWRSSSGRPDGSWRYVIDIYNSNLPRRSRPGRHG